MVHKRGTIDRRNAVRIATAEDFRSRVVTRALAADRDEGGGYLLTERFHEQLIQQEGNFSPMRGLARVLEPLGDGEDSVGVPSMEAAMADAEWTSELGAATLDSTASFGKRGLIPHPIQKRIKVSRKLLRSQTNAQMWIEEAIATAIATPQETAFIQGSGVGEPLGILTAADAGDVSTYTTEVSDDCTWDDLVRFVLGLPARFQRNATLLTTPNFLKHVFQIIDANGDPMLKDFDFSALSGGPRIVFSDGMPTAADDDGNLTAGEYAAIIGDFRWYWVVDDDTIDFLILRELYIEDNEIGFQATQQTDGMPVLENAFYCLKIKS